MDYQQCVDLLYPGKELVNVFNGYAAAASKGFFLYNKNAHSEKYVAAIASCREMYCKEENIRAALDALREHRDAAIRTAYAVFLKEVLLEVPNCMLPVSDTDAAVTAYENDILAKASTPRIVRDQQFGIYRKLAEATVSLGNPPSHDSMLLLSVCAEYLKMTDGERRVQDAIVKAYPNAEGAPHTAEELASVREALQTAGLVFSVKTENGTVCDVIPREIANVMRRCFEKEMSNRGYRRMLTYLYENYKRRFLTDAIMESGLDIGTGISVEKLYEITMRNVKPSLLIIGGKKYHRGLDRAMLSDWCGNIGLSRIGGKLDLMYRIFDYYNDFQEIPSGDPAPEA